MSDDADGAAHIPVLLHEVLQLLDPKSGDVVLDVTLGLGGHSLAFLQSVKPQGHLVALDADAQNLQRAQKRLSVASDTYTLLHANFSSLPHCLPDDHRMFDCVFADLGLSSPHVDDTLRGFSFRGDTPLDMRYDQTRGMTAADILQQWDPKKLFDIFRLYGQLPCSRALVRSIETERSVTTISSSKQLNALAHAVYGYKTPDVLPQIYQALRIAVNDELGALQTLLDVAPLLLKPNGRLAIISYHSLEDALVKHRFRQLTTPTKDPVTGQTAQAAAFALLTKKAINPQEQELRNNPRSRSARLRALRRVMVYDDDRPFPA